MSGPRHDIVNLLYSMKGMIEVHLAWVEEGKFARREEQLRHAEETLRRSHSKAASAIQITRHLRAAAEPEEEFRKPRLRASVRFAWRQVIRDLGKKISCFGIAFIERIPEGFPPVLCDRTHFYEILYQIAQNGVQAILCGGAHCGQPHKLIIRAEEGFSPAEEPSAVITVADTGPGIAKERLAYLFSPFFTTKPEGEGNGLGLCLVKRLVARNRGKIHVSSFPGSGTTFTIELPIVNHSKSLIGSSGR